MTTPATAKRVLIADDDSDARAIIAQALDSLDIEIVEASDGTMAVNICTEKLPDIAILDGMMPGKKGVEVCSFIRGQEGGELVPIIMITALDSLSDKVKALEGGADEYITKPFNYRELTARIKSLLRVRELNVKLADKNRQLQEVQEILLRQERELVISQLAGTAAHQLGQPLSAILLHCHLLKSLPQGDPKFTKALMSITDDVKSMAQMIERLKMVDPAKTSKYYADTNILDLDE